MEHLPINSTLFLHAPHSTWNGRPVFSYRETISRVVKHDLLLRLKVFARRFPRLYRFFFFVVSPSLFWGLSPRAFLKSFPVHATLIDVGSGGARLRADVISVDLYPWPGVDVIANAESLPFTDGSADAVVLSWVVEHLPHPERALQEAHRILKRGGQLYLSTNFIYPQHGAPHDYYRWTRAGLREFLRDWQSVEIERFVGPTSALLAVFAEWIALCLSFGNEYVKLFFYGVALVLLFPLKLLDILFIHYEAADNLTAGFYCTAQK